ncbi:Mechanosensory protein 2 [Taenia crassiceps]|uniref:Mechanosensory protein 2 n=1 Tax=Taenia crassiceps TaxID=6207 RepID=A0ABR4QRF5_9CEST
MNAPQLTLVNPADSSMVGSEGSLLTEPRKYSVVNPRMSMDGGPISNSKDMGCCSYILLALSYFVIMLTFPISIFFCIKVIAEYERAVLFRLGRILPGGAKGPGLFFTVPCLDMIRKVDLRTVTFDVPPQEVLTKDSVTVAVDAVVYYRIYNPVVAITNVEDADRSTRLLAATTLRNVLGTKNLSDILSERDSISGMMQTMLDEATDPWGVKVERVEVKDVRLPVQLQRAMAAEAEAAREARAKVIAARGEQKASQALKEAADVINESPFAIQLRYLQTLSTISAEKNSTIIFPLPVDLVTHFMHGKPSSSLLATTSSTAFTLGGGGGNGGDSSDSSRAAVSASDHHGFGVPPPARRRQNVGAATTSPTVANEAFAV